MPSLRLALAQMRVEPGRISENLCRAEEAIAKAASQQAQVVLLPEALDLGWTHPSAQTEAGEIPGGLAFRTLARAAAAHQVYVCAGLTERFENQVFNTAVLLDPQGGLILKHQKLNELEIGHSCYAQGSHLGVAHTPLGAFGVHLCADAFAPGQMVSRTLGLMGAQLILSPCAWAVPADHDPEREPYGRLWIENYSPVARDFDLWIAGASNVGPITAGAWQGRKCIGCSLLVNPAGQVEFMGPYGVAAEAMLYADLTLHPRPARGDGWTRYRNERPDPLRMP